MHWSGNKRVQVYAKKDSAAQVLDCVSCQVRYSQLTWFALKCDRNFFLSASACDIVIRCQCTKHRCWTVSGFLLLHFSVHVLVQKAQVLDYVSFFAFTLAFLSACACAKSTGVGLCQVRYSQLSAVPVACV